MATIPSRNFYPRSPNDYLEYNALRTPEKVETNVFDHAFGVELNPDTEDWDALIQWEDVTEMGVPELDREDSIESSTSVPENRNSEKDVLSSIFPTANEDTVDVFPFNEEAIFEAEDLISNLQSGSSIKPKRQHDFPVKFSSLVEVEGKCLHDTTLFSLVPAQFKLSSKPPSTPSLNSTLRPFSTPPTPRKVCQQKLKRRKSSRTKKFKFPHSVSQGQATHNAIEKRYRESLNKQFDLLRKGIPSLCRDLDSKDESKPVERVGNSNVEAESRLVRRKYGKQDIIINALRFIKELEETAARLCAEKQVLRNRVEAFEELAQLGLERNYLSSS
jgi:hypothetical protein